VLNAHPPSVQLKEYGIREFGGCGYPVIIKIVQVGRSSSLLSLGRTNLGIGVIQ
jgi:hypothetical protein